MDSIVIKVIKGIVSIATRQMAVAIAITVDYIA